MAVARLEFRQLHEHQLQALYHLVRILDVHHLVMVVIVRCVRFKHLVDQIEGPDRLKQLVVVTPVRLFYIGLCRIEEHPGLEFWSPVYLHLHKELAALLVLAAHIHYAVFAQRSLRNQFRRQVFNTSDLFLLRERKQRIQKTDHQMLVFSEHFLEGQVGFGVQIHPFLVFFFIFGICFSFS